MGCSSPVYATDRPRPQPSPYKGSGAWGVYVALTLTLTVYERDFFWNFLRVNIELGMLSLLLMLLAPLRWRRIALAATLALWAVTSFAIAPITNQLF